MKSQRGYDLLFRQIEPKSDDWLRQIINSTRVDGVLVIGQSDQLAVLDAVGGSYKPLVVWRENGARGRNTSRWAPTMWERLAAEHLIGRGRRTLAFLGHTSVPEFRGSVRGVRVHVAARAP